MNEQQAKLYSILAQKNNGIAQPAVTGMDSVTPEMSEADMRKLMEQQLVEGMRSRQADSAAQQKQLQAEQQKQGSFQQADLSGLVGLAGWINNDPTPAQSYHAPKTNDDKIRLLQDAITKGKSGMADDQTNFLKLKLQQKVAAMNPYQEARIAQANDRMAQLYGQNMSKSLDPSAASPASAFGRAARTQQAAQKINVLAEQQPDLNFSKNQMTELATASANLLSNGSQTAQAQIEHLLPPGIERSAAGIEDWLSGDPHGTGQAGFARQMLETAAREHDLAAEQIYKAQQDRLTGFQRFNKMSPPEYDAIKNQYVVEPQRMVKDTIKSIQDHSFQTPGQSAGAPKTATASGPMTFEEFRRQKAAAKNAK